jgi:hypothetical protein
VTEQLGHIGNQTLILGGRHYVSNPYRWTTVLHEGITGSELVMFEDSGPHALGGGARKVPRHDPGFYEAHLVSQALVRCDDTVIASENQRCAA